MIIDDASAIYLPNGSGRAVVALLREFAFDADAVLSECQISEEEITRPGLIKGTSDLALHRAFARETDDRRDLWLKLGLRHRLAGDGDFGMALLTAPTLSHCARLTDAYHGLTHSVSTWKSVSEAGVIVGVQQELSFIPIELRMLTLYRDIGSSLACFESIAPHHLQLMTMMVPLAQNEIEKLRTLSNFRGIVQGKAIGWSWPPDLAKKALPYGDEVLHQYHSDLCREALHEYYNANLEIRVRALVRAQISNVTIASLAQTMGLSTRTLQRRLDEENICFRSVVDLTRKHLAQERLLHSNKPISSIAYELGYRSQASFSHAFRRWTGTHPTGFRLAAIGQ